MRVSYLANGAEGEGECYPGPCPSFHQDSSAAMQMENMAAFQLKIIKIIVMEERGVEWEDKLEAAFVYEQLIT